jgi:hypothetical protein
MELKTHRLSLSMNVIARSPGGTVARHEAKQSVEIQLNLVGLLRHPSGVPRNDVNEK